MSLRSGPSLAVTLDELRTRFPLAKIHRGSTTQYPITATPLDLDAAVEEAVAKVAAYKGKFPPTAAFTFLTCVKCAGLLRQPPCPNCGRERFAPAEGAIECENCKLLWSRWDCSACGASNPFFDYISGTISNLEVPVTRKCFVASAAAGEDSAAVTALRVYRDTVLQPTLAGSLLIRVYDHVGPWLARLVLKSAFAKTFVRSAIVLPAARYARRRPKSKVPGVK